MKSLLASMVVGTALVAAGAPASTARRQTVLPMQNAIATGSVRVVIRGTGASSGDSVLLTVTRTAKSPAGALVLSIPAGTLLRSTRDGYQDMVVMAVRGVWAGRGRFRPTSRVVVARSGSVTYVLSAYCIDGERTDPSSAVRFAVGPRDAGLACIGRESRGLTMPALQATIWMRSEGIDVEEVARRISLRDRDWDQAMGALRRCARGW